MYSHSQPGLIQLQMGPIIQNKSIKVLYSERIQYNYKLIPYNKTIALSCPRIQ